MCVHSQREKCCLHKARLFLCYPWTQCAVQDMKGKRKERQHSRTDTHTHRISVRLSRLQRRVFVKRETRSECLSAPPVLWHQVFRLCPTNPFISHGKPLVSLGIPLVFSSDRPSMGKKIIMETSPAPLHSWAPMRRPSYRPYGPGPRGGSHRTREKNIPQFTETNSRYRTIH